MTELLIIATGHGAPGLFHDEVHLPDAFRSVGWELDVRPWQEIEPDGTPIVVRTAWDYTQQPAQFHEWLHAIDAAGGPCINATRTLRWNMDKRYLLELEARGHAIVPTITLDTYTNEAAVNAAAKQGWSEAIAKPVVGGGAEGLVLIRDGAARPFNLAGNTWAADASPTPVGACLIQPFLPAIHDGEWSLFFFGGQLSHAIRKTPAPGDIRVQEEHGGTTAAAQAPAHVVAAAQRLALDVDAVVARVDGLDVDGQFLLMELELIEPELYFRYAAGAEERFAQAVGSALAL